MRKRDGRNLPDAALEVLRERAVTMLEAGNSQVAIAAALGVHKNTVSRWLTNWRVAGAAALKARKRGRRYATQRLLDARQTAEVQALITGHGPDDLGLPFALWSREAVRDLVRARMGVTLAIRTVGDYLRRWGFTPQRPIRRARERQDAAVRAWLAEHYPRIVARAKAERAQIHWGDETGISNQGLAPSATSPRRSVAIGSKSSLRRSGRRRRISLKIVVELTKADSPPERAGFRQSRPTMSQESV